MSEIQAPHRLKLLLVEDHDDTAVMLKLLLESYGYDVDTAGSVARSLEMAQRQSYDALISDLGLPDGSGLELVAALRRSGIDIPAIALSGFGRESDIEESRGAGFAAHLVKPVDADRLAAAVEEIAAKARRSKGIAGPSDQLV